MNLAKKTRTRLTLSIISLISFLIVTNLILMLYSSRKLSNFIIKLYDIQVTKNISNFIDISKATTKKLSLDEKIIRVLYDNKNKTINSDTDKEILKNQITLYEKILEPITFIKNINIVNIEGEYLFSNEILHESFDIKARPWLKDKNSLNFNEPFITNIYEDLYTGEETISVINFIYSKDAKEPLGAVILDIVLTDLLEYINSNFYLGNINSYIKTNDSQYISADAIYGDSSIDTNVGISLSFDKNSILYNKQIKMIYKTTTFILIITGVIALFVLIKILSLLLKPIINSLDKLKILLKNLEENNFNIESTDEFEQLEFISESLGKSFHNKIHSLIYNDELTSLPNRKMLSNIGSSLIKSKKPFALLFIDLNNFKYVNDSFGHNAGDALLITFSNLLKNIFNNKGIVTRYSGDEFVIIYDNYINDEELLNFYNTVVLPQFSKPLYFNNTSIIIEFSAGASVYPRDDESFDKLIHKSDFMMYTNKQNTDSNDLLIFNNDMYNKIKKREDIKFQLRSALARNEFYIHYQPIVNEFKKIKKVEALIRWNNKKLNYVSPIDFINCAEEIGEIIPIGYWIIEEVCKDLNSIYNDINSLEININVSPIQLVDINFVNNVEKILNKYNVDFSNLCFEITESVILDENTTVYDNINLLHKRGSKIALDDFGTGYASFNYLRKYKLDILKIDKVFINNIDEKSLSIINNIKNIAHLLDMKVIIEGVETIEQFESLKKIGCDYFQGYYFSKPITIQEFKKILDT